jgi:hypothetical protein
MGMIIWSVLAVAETVRYFMGMPMEIDSIDVLLRDWVIVMLWVEAITSSKH